MDFVIKCVVIGVDEMAKRESLFSMLENKTCINLEVDYGIIKKLLHDGSEFFRMDSVENVIDEYIIKDWKYNVRCLKLEDLEKKLEITKSNLFMSGYSEEKCLIYFELIYNLVQEVKRKYIDTDENGRIVLKEENLFKIIDNIENIVDELGYEIQKSNDIYQIIEKDIIATAVAEKNADISEKVISYRRFSLKGDIEAKKEIILKLAEKMEPLRSKFKSTSYNVLMDDVQMLLNNLNLRHNNLDGVHKKDYVISMKTNELEKWYDRTYDMILGIIMLNDYLDSKENLKELKLNLK